VIEKTIAKSLSVLFHPIVYPTYGFLLLYFFDDQFVLRINDQAKLYVLGVVFMNTFLFPAALLYIFKKRGLISSLKLEKREERFYPLFIGLLFYAATWYLINRLPLPIVYSYILAISTALTVSAIFVNFFFKISLHSLGSAAFSAALLGIAYVYNLQIMFTISIAFLLSGLIASSRLVLNAHKPSQVYVGLVLGFLSGLFVLVFII
jgi:membrane-associated phospholipid phosphatase